MDQETVVISGVVRTLLENGFSLTVNNGVEDVIRVPTRNRRLVVNAITKPDYVCSYHYIIAHREGRKYWVRFIHGAGENVLNDYSMGLHPVLGKVSA